MNEGESTWRELYRSDDPDHIRAVATTIAAMEFDVQCADAGRIWEGPHEAKIGKPPYVIRVPEAHWPQLAPVIEEIIAEQEEFDELLMQRDLRARQLRRRILLMALIVVMAALGLLGLLQV